MNLSWANLRYRVRGRLNDLRGRAGAIDTSSTRTRRRLRLIPLVAAVAVAVVVVVLLTSSGGEVQPGSPGDQEAVRKVVEEFVTAGNRLDFETVCDLFTEQSRRQLGGDACAEVLSAQAHQRPGTPKRVRVVHVRIRGNAAAADTVVTAIGQRAVASELVLFREHGSWHVAAARGPRSAGAPKAGAKGKR
jgi:hypothetical protein